MKSVTWCDKVLSSSACWTNREERCTSHKWLEFGRNMFLACTAVCHWCTLDNGENHCNEVLEMVLAYSHSSSFVHCHTAHFQHVVYFQISSYCQHTCWWTTTFHRFCRSTKCNGHASLKSCRDIGFECTWPWVVDSSRL